MKLPRDLSGDHLAAALRKLGYQVIFSGDKKHLLPLRRFRGISILSPSDFLRSLPAVA